jgi:hypothetical protein
MSLILVEMASGERLLRGVFAISAAANNAVRSPDEENRGAPTTTDGVAVAVDRRGCSTDVRERVDRSGGRVKVSIGRTATPRRVDIIDWHDPISGSVSSTRGAAAASDERGEIHNDAGREGKPIWLVAVYSSKVAPLRRAIEPSASGRCFVLKSSIAEVRRSRASEG